MIQTKNSQKTKNPRQSSFTQLVLFGSNLVPTQFLPGSDGFRQFMTVVVPTDLNSHLLVLVHMQCSKRVSRCSQMLSAAVHPGPLTFYTPSWTVVLYTEEVNLSFEATKIQTHPIKVQISTRKLGPFIGVLKEPKRPSIYTTMSRVIFQTFMTLSSHIFMKFV